MRVNLNVSTAAWLEQPALVAQFRASLLAFFYNGQRPLPWRETTDPYAILVSEIMLQQTRVETVVPYYRTWITRFPDLSALARASEEEVLRVWQGLGYYRRARNLHRLAKELVAEGGGIPTSTQALEALPGIGAYTAGAVASIAFGQPVPAVDGNVRRVLARLFDDPSPSPATLRRIAGVLVDPVVPGDFNQALMELGAVKCTPRGPSCETCPVADFCLSRRAGTQADRPAPAPRRAVPHVHEVAVLLLWRPLSLPSATAHVLLTRRPDRGLLAGMWTLPLKEIPDPSPESIGAASASLAQSLAPTTTAGGTRQPALDHVFTHRRVTYHPVQFVLTHPVDPPPPPEPMRWVDREGLDGLPLPRAQQKLLGGAQWDTSS